MNYVYNLKRVSKTEVKKQYALPVLFAQNIETKIHKKYKHKRIDDITKKSHKFWDRHTKIGFSNDPKTRVTKINKSELKDGRTEYFDLNPIDRIVIFFILLYYFLRPWLLLILIFAFVYMSLK